MKIERAAFAAVLTASLAGCAASPDAAGPQAASASGDTVCTRESVTGSTITFTRCRTAAEVEAERRNAEAVAERVRGGGMPQSGQGAVPGGR